METVKVTAGEHRRWSWWETGTLALFTAVVAGGLRWHEGWADEAQAWLLARDMGWWQMMLHGVRYEGSPGLWHSVLWVLARLHLSYGGMHYVGGFFEVVGMWIFLRFAPFPRYLKLLLPFTFFLAYQDAVIARSYVMFAAFSFGAAALLRRPQHKPLTLAVVLGLMANLSVHGCVASAGLAIVAAIKAWRDGSGKDRRQWLAAAVVLLFWGIAVGSALSPRDIDFAAARESHNSRVLVHDARGTHWLYSNDQIPVDPDPDKPHIVTQSEAAKSETMQPHELAPIPLVRTHFAAPERWARKLGHILGLVTFPLATSRSTALLTVAFLIAYVWIRQKTSFGTDRMADERTYGWVALIPYALMIAAFSKIYIAPRHMGTVLTIFLVTLWLVWPTREQAAGETGRSLWLRTALSIALLLVTLEQVGWTEEAILRDMSQPYSGDWTTGAYLRSIRNDGPIAGFYYLSIGALAYVKDFKYVNQPDSYWTWSRNIRTNQDAPAVLAQHPAYIVVGGFMWGNQADVAVDWMDAFQGLPYMPMADSYRIVPFFKQHGYVETHRLCGRQFMRDGYSEETCDLILEPYVPED